MKNILGCIAIFVLLVVASCKKNEPHIVQPVACFNNMPDTVTTNDKLSFTNCSASATSYMWNFGDGTTSDSANTMHKYSVPGTYTVSLTAINGGVTDSASEQIIVIKGITVDDYVGTYVGSDDCFYGNTGGYPVTITKTSAHGIAISNFGNLGYNMPASVNENKISMEVLLGANNFIIGDGTINSSLNSIQISYTYNDNVNHTRCFFTAYKQ